MKLGPYDLGPDDENQGIYTGDARELAKAIPDESVDLIFTDPPYHKEFLPLYEFLFELSARVLKPSGFCLTYAGGYWKNKIFSMADERLEYFWDYSLLMKGNSTIIWPRRTIARCKSILAFRRIGSKALPRTNVLGAWQGGNEDKRFHEWGQDEETARYYISCFCKNESVVFDPFVGGGTTLAIARRLNMRGLGFEINDMVACVARTRVTHDSYQHRLPFKHEQLSFDFEE